ncbi:GDP-mannose 4,6-dehydratase [Methylophilaceae bacterium]|nr:GDP-mannose 4,6-dehydratase [Methylophilaceae bacterium]
MKILVTGSEGFTGIHFMLRCKDLDIEVVELKSNLLDVDGLKSELKNLKIDYVVHLAGISFIAHDDQNIFKKVNVDGTENLLAAIKLMKVRPNKILLASTANLYGLVESGEINEQILPSPQNSYGHSKLMMENIALDKYGDSFDFIIARPFNYTGKSQNLVFVVPKIVDHFKKKSSSIELGSLDVRREFNDVRFVVDCYIDLLMNVKKTEIINICSGITYSINDIINEMKVISNHQIKVNVNPEFLRENEIKSLKGNPEKLYNLSSVKNSYNLNDTLLWMYK